MKKSRLLGAVCACLTIVSFNASAAIVTQGYLTSDDTTNIITDSLNNVEYLRLDVLAALTYAQTLGVLGTQDGGGWAIATPDEAIGFTAAALGGAASCSHDGTIVTAHDCGSMTGWTGGKLGDDYLLGVSRSDLAWFLDEAGQADYVSLISNGLIEIFDATLAYSDTFASSGTNSDIPVTWLVVRPTEVPLPPAVWLFSAGLLGIFGAARRKVRF